MTNVPTPTPPALQAEGAALSDAFRAFAFRAGELAREGIELYRAGDRDRSRAVLGRIEDSITDVAVEGVGLMPGDRGSERAFGEVQEALLTIVGELTPEMTVLAALVDEGKPGRWWPEAWRVMFAEAIVSHTRHELDGVARIDRMAVPS